MANDYPVDLRADYPERSSRGWAVLTILLIKFLALIPHFIVLFFLTIAQALVSLVAQVVVAVKGEYPQGMFRFVEGVLRWNTRVAAFVLSLTDRYPPFALRSDVQYPVDVVIERPERSSRLYALFTLLVEVLVIAAAVGFAIWAASANNLFEDGGAYDEQSPWSANANLSSSSPSILVLRVLAALPHEIIVAVLGIAVFIIWLIVQWVILFVATYPRGMHNIVVGVTRWRTRVSAYTLGLIDRYPPFTFEPSLTVAGAGSPPAPQGPPPLGAPEVPPPSTPGSRPPGPGTRPAEPPAPRSEDADEGPTTGQDGVPHG
jgi:hypothetical protein